MIESSADNIHILYPDGSSAVFDSTELRTRLGRSLAEANQEDYSIAEDIALAVDFSLRSALRQSGIRHIPASELDHAVAKSLEDAGYGLVAEKFLAASPESSAVSKLRREELSLFLARTLNLEEPEAGVMGEKIRECLLFLGFEKCSPRLALELAREIRDQEAEKVLQKQKMKILQSKRSFLPSSGEIIAKLPEKYKDLFNAGIIKLCESTALFPSVRVEIVLEKLLTLLPEKPGENTPVTELMLSPALAFCAAAVDTLYEEMGKSSSSGKLPLVITFSDMNLFAGKYLLTDHNEGVPDKCVRNLGMYFRGMLKNPPFRLRYGK